jgi:hypothetical protein
VTTVKFEDYGRPRVVREAELPHNLSGLLELALKDLDEVTWMPDKYEVCMVAFYHRAPAENKCFVCLAGAVMANTLGYQREDIADDVECILPKFLPHRDKLYALDSLRQGFIGRAYEDLTGKDIFEFHVVDVDVCEYDDNPVQWRKDMDTVLTQLKDLGL